MSTSHKRTSSKLNKAASPIGIILLVGLTFLLLYGMEGLLGINTVKLTYEEYLKKLLECEEQYTRRTFLLHQDISETTQKISPLSLTRRYCRIWKRYVMCYQELNQLANMSLFEKHVIYNGTVGLCNLHFYNTTQAQPAAE